jgi:hypothetical protein
MIGKLCLGLCALVAVVVVAGTPAARTGPSGYDLVR